MSGIASVQKFHELTLETCCMAKVSLQLYCSKTKPNLRKYTESKGNNRHNAYIVVKQFGFHSHQASSNRAMIPPGF